jgi:hypothetical protein
MSTAFLVKSTFGISYLESSKRQWYSTNKSAKSLARLTFQPHLIGLWAHIAFTLPKSKIAATNFSRKYLMDLDVLLGFHSSMLVSFLQSVL